MYTPSELQKRILLEIFIAPIAFIPGVLGTTVALGGWAFERPGTALLGLAMMAVAVGLGATRAVLFGPQIAQNLIRDAKAKKLQQEQQAYEQLYRDLYLVNQDDAQHLVELRDVYSTFVQDLDQGKISPTVSPEIIESIHKLYKSCFEHFKQFLKAKRGTKTRMRDEIQETIECLSETIARVRDLSEKGPEHNEDDLKVTRDRLNSQLQVAENVQRRLQNIFGNGASEHFTQAEN